MKLAYRVDIVASENADPAFGEQVHSGNDYQAAFDAAVAARHNEKWRGKWIRFQTPEITKWAKIS